MTEKNTETVSDLDYSLSAAKAKKIDAPRLPYRPKNPVNYRPKIGLIGAGGITRSHLSAYKAAGYDVAVICNRTLERAEQRAAEFYPDAKVTTNFEEVLADESIEVLDIATHPAERVSLIERALNAGRHVLSQKPFVLDIEVGRRLVDLANAKGVKLAVNQNGRWAPHMSYMREAVRAGLIGNVNSVHCDIHWNHNWIAGTPFDDINDLILSDFGVHWFDFILSITGCRAKSVYARFARSVDQTAKPPLFAQVVIELEAGQASLIFDGGTVIGARDSTFIAGSEGSLESIGSDLDNQQVKLTTQRGESIPDLKGNWFKDGFHGTMAELLCAIEEERTPLNDAARNLSSLELCFAALRSAEEGVSVAI